MNQKFFAYATNVRHLWVVEKKWHFVTQSLEKANVLRLRKVAFAELAQ
jgi:hypothetical protein